MNNLAVLLKSSFVRRAKDPFTLCCIAGVLVFLGSFLIDRDPTNTEIVISEADINRIEQQWLLEQGRLPSSTELDGLIASFAHEEMQVREALAMGLDYNDTIIRRRLVQKYQFITEDEALNVPASEEDLRRFFEENEEMYITGPRITFKHIFFNSANETATPSHIQSLTPTVNDKNWYSFGDPFPLTREFHASTHSQIANVLGSQFLTALLKIEDGAWVGPVESTYGTHLVRIIERHPAELQSFDAIQRRVQLDYDAQRRDQAYEKVLAELSTRYQVVIEPQSDE